MLRILEKLWQSFSEKLPGQSLELVNIFACDLPDYPPS